jgi:hypothetical protein
VRCDVGLREREMALPSIIAQVRLITLYARLGSTFACTYLSAAEIIYLVLLYVPLEK